MKTGPNQQGSIEFLWVFLRVGLNLRDSFSKQVLENCQFLPHAPCSCLKLWFPGILLHASVTLAESYPNRALCGFWPRIA